MLTEKKDLSAKLEAIRDAYASAPVGQLAGDLAPGSYPSKVLKGVFGTTKAGDKFLATWNMEVAAGEMVGRKYFIRRAIKDERGWGNLKGDVARLGLEPAADVADVGALMEEAVGAFCLVEVSINSGKDESGEAKEYTNYHIIKTIDPIDNETLPTIAPKKQVTVAAQPLKKIAVQSPAPQKTGIMQLKKPVKPAPQLLQEDTADEAEDPQSDAEAGPIELNFTDNDMDDEGQAEIQRLGIDQGFALKNFDTHVDLLKAVCEKLELTGTFNSVQAVLKLLNTDA